MVAARPAAFDWIIGLDDILLALGALDGQAGIQNNPPVRARQDRKNARRERKKAAIIHLGGKPK
jgi:hypothetical protein